MNKLEKIPLEELKKRVRAIGTYPVVVAKLKERGYVYNLKSFQNIMSGHAKISELFLRRFLELEIELEREKGL